MSKEEYTLQDYTLQPSDIQKYRSDGWILLRNVMPKNLLQEYAREIREMTDAFAQEHYAKIPLAQRSTYGKAFIQHENLFLKSDKIKEYVTMRAMGKIACELMGTDGVRVYHDQALFKEPGNGSNPTPLHMDQMYWPLDAKTITMWMPLKDCLGEHGTMHFASASQSLGYLGRMPISDESEEKLGALVREKFPIEYAGDMSAGDVTLHNGWTIHGAKGNKGSTMREAMTIIFIEEKCKIVEPDSPERRSDLSRWFPGLKPGDIAASPINPLVYHKCWEKRFKLIATDLDGTLVRPDGQISARTIAALDKARKSAILVLVTGRPARWLNHVMEQLVHDHEGAVVICSNGAILMDCVTKKFLSVREIPVDVLKQVTSLAEELIPGGCGFACERTSGLRRHEAYPPRFISAGTDKKDSDVLTEEELFSEPCVKLLIRPKQNWTSDELMGFLAPAVHHLIQITHATPSGWGLLECASLGTTKAHTLEAYATSLGISREDVISFGDQPNDVEMLQWAGCGVAMGDGHALAKEAAHSITASCEDDGVARVLEQIYS
jgi:Cof subfamily protein (haloacid dehalogenase superfamily)